MRDRIPRNLNDQSRGGAAEYPTPFRMKRLDFASAAPLWLFLALAGALSCSLAGCDLSAGKPRIGVDFYSADDSFIASARRSLEAQAQGKALLSVQDALNQQTLQNQQIDAMFADKATAVIVNPVEASSMDALVFRAKVANVPIIFFSREPSTMSIAMWDKAYFVGVDSVDAARLQAEILSDYWKTRPDADANKDGKLQYILIKGDKSQSDASYTKESRQAAFDKAGVQAVDLAEVVASWNRAEAKKAILANIASMGATRFEAVICANDDMALGVIDGLKVANYLSPSGDMIAVVGTDGTPFALDAIASGSLLGTVRGDAASQGKAAFDLAYALSKGADPRSTGWFSANPKIVLVPYQKVTRDNYQSFL
jgi:methyl-galactoside transport system substrate-binding protein